MMIDEESEQRVLLQYADRHNLRNGELVWLNVGFPHASERSAIDAVKADRDLLNHDQLRIVLADPPHQTIRGDSWIRLRVPGSGS